MNVTGLVLFNQPIDRIEFNGDILEFYNDNDELVCTFENIYCLEKSNYLFNIRDISGFINVVYYLRKD